MELDNRDVTLDEFYTWKVEALREFLSKRGLARDGTKQELCALCFAAQSLHLPIQKSDHELCQQNLRDYDSILKIDINYELPDPLRLSNGWLDEKTSITLWPPLFVSDIINFLIGQNDSSTSTKKYLNEYKIGKAYEYFSAAWLGEIFYHRVTADSLYCLLRSSCTPSQRIKDESHKVWVCLEKESGAVKAAYCSCTAGLGQTCNHVAGLLFKVEHANKYGYSSCTSQTCSWNIPKQSTLQPQQISEMTIKKSRHGRTGNPRPLTTPSKKLFQPVEVHSELDSLSRALKDVLPNACLFKGLPNDDKGNSADQTRPATRTPNTASVPIFDINCHTQSYLVKKFKEEIGDDSSNYSSFSTFIKPTQDIICQINESTIGQSANSKWHALREGRITASNFYAIHTKMKTLQRKQADDQENSVRSLLSKIMGYTKPNPNLKPLKYGREMEPVAKETYKVKHSKCHSNASYQECGLFLDKDRPYLSASPDLLVECSCCGKGLLEIKCPMIAKCDNCSSFCTCILPSFIHFDDKSCLTIRKLSPYYGQVQGQMAITGRAWCDFFVYTCNGCFCERILYDEAFVSNMYMSLDQFYQNFVIPELFLRSVQKDLFDNVNDVMEVDQSVNLATACYFCPICQNLVKDEANIKSFGERSILCEACDKWFHFKCVKMTKASLNELNNRKWLCAECHARM